MECKRFVGGRRPERTMSDSASLQARERQKKGLGRSVPTHALPYRAFPVCRDQEYRTYHQAWILCWQPNRRRQNLVLLAYTSLAFVDTHTDLCSTRRSMPPGSTMQMNVRSLGDLTFICISVSTRPVGKRLLRQLHSLVHLPSLDIEKLHDTILKVCTPWQLISQSSG